VGEGNGKVNEPVKKQQKWGKNNLNGYMKHSPGKHQRSREKLLGGCPRVSLSVAGENITLGKYTYEKGRTKQRRAGCKT